MNLTNDGEGISTLSGNGSTIICLRTDPNPSGGRTGFIEVTNDQGSSLWYRYYQYGNSSNKGVFLETSTLSLPSQSSSGRVLLYSNDEWQTASDAAWLSVYSTSGSTNASLLVRVSENAGAERSANITVTSTETGDTVTLRVTQAGVGSGISASPSSVTFTKEGEQDIQLTVNGPWSAECTGGEWLTFGDGSRKHSGSGSAAIRLRCTASAAASSEGAVVFTAEGGASATVRVTRSLAQTLSLSPTQLSFPSPGDQIQQVAVTASGQWSAVCSDPWIALSSLTAEGCATVKVRCMANSSASNRSGSVTFKDLAGNVAVLKVEQAGSSLSVSPASLSFSAVGSNKALTLSADGAWSAKCFCDDGGAWLLIGLPSANHTAQISSTGNANLSVLCLDNDTGAPRKGCVDFTCNGRTVSVAVTQEAAALSDSIDVYWDDRGTPLTNGQVLELSNAMQKVSLSITASTDCSVTTSFPGWLSQTLFARKNFRSSGLQYNAVFQLYDNSTFSQREQLLTLKAGDTIFQITLRQMATIPDISLSRSTWDIDWNEDGMLLLKLSANDGWSVTDKPGWLYITDTGGNEGKNIGVGVRAEPNRGYSKRTGVITFSNGYAKATLTVTQKALDRIIYLLDEDGRTPIGSTLELTTGTTKKIYVLSPYDWALSTDSKTLSVSPASGSPNKATAVTLRCDGTQPSSATLSLQYRIRMGRTYSTRTKTVTLLIHDASKKDETIPPSKERTVVYHTTELQPNQIRYISQNSTVDNYLPAFWEYTKDDKKYTLNSKYGCFISSASMALSSLGIDLLPGQMLLNGGVRESDAYINDYNCYFHEKQQIRTVML
ncbi:MAG: BACON domain-containing carbohydrate-binding protein [Eubacteriales bacterium]|nr:BACON domain-containing carbohydrate-binding protein [Eubacteriales bacterium]